MFTFNMQFQDHGPYNVEIKSRVSVESEDLQTVAQAFHDFLLASGFSIDRVVLSTKETSYASEFHGRKSA